MKDTALILAQADSLYKSDKREEVLQILERIDTRMFDTLAAQEKYYLWYMRGEVYRKAGDITKADECYRTGLTYFSEPTAVAHDRLKELGQLVRSPSAAMKCEKCKAEHVTGEIYHFHYGITLNGHFNMSGLRSVFICDQCLLRQLQRVFVGGTFAGFSMAGIFLAISIILFNEAQAFWFWFALLGGFPVIMILYNLPKYRMIKTAQAGGKADIDNLKQNLAYLVPSAGYTLAVNLYGPELRRRGYSTFTIGVMQPTVTSKESLTDRAPGMLINIYDHNPNGIYPHTSAEKEVKAIGQMIYNAGGMELMLAVHKRFMAKYHNLARNLEMIWDGIGEWRG